MCKIKTILRYNDNVVYTDTIDVEVGTISSLDVPSGCIIDLNTQSMDIQYKFPTSTEGVAKYPMEDYSKIKFEYGKVSGKIHRYTVLREEIIHQTDTFRVLDELFNISESERFQGNIKGFLKLSSDLINYTIEHFMIDKQ